MLTEALTKLLQRKQINEITVTELTELADMNRGTFYLYYRDIYDMLGSVEEELFQRLEQILGENLQPMEPAVIRTKLIDLFSFVKEYQDLCRILLSPNGDMNFLHRMNTVLRERLMAQLPAGQDPGVQAEFEYLYQFVVFGLGGLIRSWVSRRCAEPVEQMAEMATRLVAKSTENLK